MSDYKLIQGDCFEELKVLENGFADLIYVDPPYLLSNGGFTCNSGKAASVNKGNWDKSQGFKQDSDFHSAWLKLSSELLSEHGSLVISGTYHSIYICGYLALKEGFHIINDLAWFKPNGSPNLSCRMFTASHETIIWLKKSKNSKHYFNYDEMKYGSFPEDKLKAEGKQMRSVWSIPSPGKNEKEFGKHPTQKPLNLMKRLITSLSKKDDTILDFFMGSGTTGVAALELGRKFIGVEINESFFAMAKERIEASSNNSKNVLVL